jgi:hypothetical protein
MNKFEELKAFTRHWELMAGREPAPYQKAIALQRLEKGQQVRDIVLKLMRLRVVGVDVEYALINGGQV